MAAAAARPSATWLMVGGCSARVPAMELGSAEIAASTTTEAAEAADLAARIRARPNPGVRGARIDSIPTRDVGRPEHGRARGAGPSRLAGRAHGDRRRGGARRAVRGDLRAPVRARAPDPRLARRGR